MSPLDHLLDSMKLQSALYAHLHAGAPWGIHFHHDHHSRFVLLAQGSAWLSSPALGAPVCLQAGDSFLVREGVPFVLQDALDTPCQRCSELFGEGHKHHVVLGGSGPQSLVLAGRFVFEQPSVAHLLAELPGLMLLPHDAERAPLLAATLQLMMLESRQPRPGAWQVISRLADVLFIQAVRRYCEDSHHRPGWLAALSDARLSPLLHAIQQAPARRWLLADMASLAGMSRSRFALYFRAVVGDSPASYLTRWRMHQAACLLRDSPLPLVRIAEQTGYDSEVAFSRAFKRTTGYSPGQYRRQQGSAMVA